MNKRITYDHGDYRAELDGRLIGYYPNHHAAEVALDELVFDMLTHGDAETAQALNGAQPTDAELVDQAEAVRATPLKKVLWSNVWNWTHSGGIASRVHLTTADGHTGKTLCGKEFPAEKGCPSGYATCKACWKKSGLTVAEYRALTYVD